MPGLLETGANVLNDVTGGAVDLREPARDADNLIEETSNAVAETVNGGTQATYEVFQNTAEILEPVFEVFLGSAEVVEPENPQTNTNNVENTEDTDSLLAGVDLFDLNSIDDAISRAQDMIANGEGDAGLFQELQLLLNAQMQMISLFSNMQKVQHDTAMAAINNIR